MSDTDFSPEEQSALDAMQSDDTPVVETPAEPETVEPEAEEARPEFKPTRNEKPPEGFVPHQAMHAERVRRQEMEAELAEMRKWREEREAAEAKSAEPQYVDPLIDPEGFRKWNDHNNAQLRSKIEEQSKVFEQQRTTQMRAQEASRLESEFAAITPDYQEAAKFIQQARANELMAYGYTEQQVKMQLAQDANALFDAGQRTGVNPAQLLYLQAQQRGYQQKRPAQDEAAKVEALANAQKQTQSLGSGGGKQGGQLTVAQLAEMSEDELGKVPESVKIAALGG